jgi:hypothetical protein
MDLTTARASVRYQILESECLVPCCLIPLESPNLQFFKVLRFQELRRFPLRLASSGSPPSIGAVLALVLTLDVAIVTEIQRLGG